VIRAAGALPSAGGLLAALILTSGCAGRVPPAEGPRPPRASVAFAARFSARASGDVAGRITGLLAVDPGGGLRVEIPGPAGSIRFLLVANEEATTMTLGSERLHHRGAPDEAILEDLFGLEIPARQAAAILGGGAATLPAGCAARARRWRPLTVGEGMVPTRFRIGCGASRLSLKLSEPAALPPPARGAAFASLPAPPGYREAAASEVARALTRAER